MGTWCGNFSLSLLSLDGNWRDWVLLHNLKRPDSGSMGSSSKKKKDKKKDFQVCPFDMCRNIKALMVSQKPKLKVGKARPKPSNFTDTSFKAKCTAAYSQHQ